MIRIVKFVIAGGITTLTTYLIFALLVISGIKYQTALICEYAAGIIIGYSLQRSWTFKSGVKLSQSFLKYLTLYVLIYFANRLSLQYLIEIKAYNSLISQGFCLLVLSAISFIIQRKIIFLEKKT